MSNQEVKYVIELVDRFGKPLKSLEKGIDSASNKVDKLNAAFDKSRRDPYSTQNRSLAELRSNVDRYRIAAENSFRLDHIRKYNRLIEETEKKIKKIENAAKTCKQETEDVFNPKDNQGFFGKMKENFGIGKGMIFSGLAISASKKATELSKEAIAAASQIEKYEVTLKTMLGTTEAARDRMQEYFDIAKKTPFDMPQVVEAGNKLQALGRYSRDNVTMLGDLAAASGKPMEQAMNAFSKMASGQKGIAVDMFRDLLITVDDWTTATGKGVSKSGELLATTEELIAALPGIMKAKGFLGMMANQSAITEGKVSNLEDAFFQLKVAAGDRLKPSYNSFIKSNTRAVEAMQRWVEIPIEQKIATEKAELNALVDSLIDSTDNEDKRSTIIDELQRKYPDFIKNIDIEKASTEELRKELEKTNAEYDKKIRKAAFQRQIKMLEDKMGNSMDDIVKYETSMQATKHLQKNKSEQRNLLRSVLGENGKDISSYSFDSDGNVMYTPVSYGSYGIPQRQKSGVDISEEQRQQAIVLKAEEKAIEEMRTFFGNDEKRRDKAQKEYESYKLQKSVIETMFETDETQSRKELLKKAQAVDANEKGRFKERFEKTEFLSIVETAEKNFESVTEEQWNRLERLMNGNGVNEKTKTGGNGAGMILEEAEKTKTGGNGAGMILEEAERIISGGGRSVKNITINVESLIGVNNNNFEEGQTPINKEEFVDQLKSTLFGVLNDVNAVA